MTRTIPPPRRIGPLSLRQGAWCECTFSDKSVAAGIVELWDARRGRYKMSTGPLPRYRIDAASGGYLGPDDDDDGEEFPGPYDWTHAKGGDASPRIREIRPSRPVLPLASPAAGPAARAPFSVARAWLVAAVEHTIVNNRRYFLSPKTAEALANRAVVLDCSDGHLRSGSLLGVDDGSGSRAAGAPSVVVEVDLRTVEEEERWEELAGTGPDDDAQVADNVALGGAVRLAVPASAFVFGAGSKLRLAAAAPESPAVRAALLGCGSRVPPEKRMPAGQWVAVGVYNRAARSESVLVARVAAFDPESGRYYLSASAEGAAATGLERGIFHTLQKAVWVRSALTPKRAAYPTRGRHFRVAAVLYLGLPPAAVPPPLPLPVLVDVLGSGGNLLPGSLVAHDAERGVYTVDVAGAGAGGATVRAEVPSTACAFTLAGLLRFVGDGHVESYETTEVDSEEEREEEEERSRLAQQRSKAAGRLKPKDRSSCPTTALPIGAWARALTGDRSAPTFVGRVVARRAVDTPSSSRFIYTLCAPALGGGGAGKQVLSGDIHANCVTPLSADVVEPLIALDDDRASPAPASLLAPLGFPALWPLGPVPPTFGRTAAALAPGTPCVVYLPYAHDFAYASVASAAVAAGTGTVTVTVRGKFGSTADDAREEGRTGVVEGAGTGAEAGGITVSLAHVFLPKE